MIVVLVAVQIHITDKTPAGWSEGTETGGWDPDSSGRDLLSDQVCSPVLEYMVANRGRIRYQIIKGVG
jgi:hypothetical protein